LDTNSTYIKRCFELAINGVGYVAPNPLVGCVIVCDGNIIGEGYHQQYGGPHAEVNAINSVKDKSLLSRATLYVNLEPCSHFGKTPPCANLIIESKIPKVVICNTDPFELVSGKGIQLLRKHNIEVITGVLEKEDRMLF
jgi:diaminohydroxyphosphoribosylaminopyrimidine deaminase/5-amino-6-(5-phosphoribosylamino)uracil reductase